MNYFESLNLQQAEGLNISNMFTFFPSQLPSGTLQMSNSMHFVHFQFFGMSFQALFCFILTSNSGTVMFCKLICYAINMFLYV